MEERPFEFIYHVLKYRPQLLNLINDNLKCLENPDRYFRKIYDLVGDLFKKFK